MNTPLNPDHAEQFFWRRLQGRNSLILQWYCTKIVMESAESVFIMQNASQQEENFYS